MFLHALINFRVVPAGHKPESSREHSRGGVLRSRQYALGARATSRQAYSRTKSLASLPAETEAAGFDR